MDVRFKLILCSFFILCLSIEVFGQGFRLPISPFGQQSFGGNVFVPQNFPRPIDQTIDLERQGSFSITSQDSAQGVQLLGTTVSDGNRVIFQDGNQQGGLNGQQNMQGFQQALPGMQPGFQQGIQAGQNFITGQQGFQPNVQGGQSFVTQPGMAGFPNPNAQIQFVQGPGTQGGIGFQGVQRPATGFLPVPGLVNTNPFVSPPVTQVGGLINTAIGGFGNALPTAIPTTQINSGQNFQAGGSLSTNAFTGIQGNQQFQLQQGLLPTVMPNSQDSMGNAVNSITGSDTFDSRFSLIDPTTNTAVQDVSNNNMQGQQGQNFQSNVNFQQPPPNNMFQQVNTQNQMQAQTPFEGSGPLVQTQQPNPFGGNFENSQFQNQPFGLQPPPQFIGSGGFGALSRSEFSNVNDVQTSNNIGVQQGNAVNATMFHTMDPSIGIFLPNVLFNEIGSRGQSKFSQFGSNGFVDIFENKPRPSPIPDMMMNTLVPGFTTMSPPPTTTEGYSCQHTKCPKGQACVYDGKYRCPKWIPIIDCKCLSGCMYNDWFIPKKFVIPVDHCGNHCACERDDGVATCSQTKCPDAP